MEITRKSFIKKALTLAAGLIIAPKVVVEPLEKPSKPSKEVLEYNGMDLTKDDFPMAHVLTPEELQTITNRYVSPTATTSYKGEII